MLGPVKDVVTANYACDTLPGVAYVWVGKYVRSFSVVVNADG